MDLGDKRESSDQLCYYDYFRHLTEFDRKCNINFSYEVIKKKKRSQLAVLKHVF